MPLRVRSELGRRGRRDPALLRHTREHLAIALARVAPADRAHRGVGFHRGAVDTDPFAFDQATLGQLLQHPGEHSLMHLERQPPAGPTQPRVVGGALVKLEAEKLPERQAVGAAPLQATFAGDALEIPDQMHPEVSPRRQRRGAHRLGVEGLALALDEAIEPSGRQLRLETVVKDMPRRLGQLIPQHHHLALPSTLPTHRHGWLPPSPFYRQRFSR